MVGITDVRSLIRISLTAALLTSRSKVCLVFHVGLSTPPKTFEGEHVVFKVFKITYNIALTDVPETQSIDIRSAFKRR